MAGTDTAFRPGSLQSVGESSRRAVGLLIMEIPEYITREELERRWQRVRKFMDCDALVILQNVDQYYLTGTMQTGILWFPLDGEPLLAVRKSYERAKIESAVKNVVPFKTYSELPAMIANPGETIGF